MQTVVLAMQNSVPAKRHGCHHIVGDILPPGGWHAGHAVFLSVLFSSLGSKVKSGYQAAFAGKNPDFTKALNNPTVMADPHNSQFVAGLKGSGSGSISINDTSFLHGLNSALAHPFREAFASSMSLVFLLAAGILVVGFALSWMLKEVPLRTISAAQQAARDAAAVQAGEPAVAD